MTALTDASERPSYTNTFQVVGMACSHCVGSVTGEITESGRGGQLQPAPGWWR